MGSRVQLSRTTTTTPQGAFQFLRVFGVVRFPTFRAVVSMGTSIGLRSLFASYRLIGVVSVLDSRDLRLSYLLRLHRLGVYHVQFYDVAGRLVSMGFGRFLEFSRGGYVTWSHLQQMVVFLIVRSILTSGVQSPTFY